MKVAKTWQMCTTLEDRVCLAALLKTKEAAWENGKYGESTPTHTNRSETRT